MIYFLRVTLFDIALPLFYKLDTNSVVNRDIADSTNLFHFVYRVYTSLANNVDCDIPSRLVELFLRSSTVTVYFYLDHLYISSDNIILEILCYLESI